MGAICQGNTTLTEFASQIATMILMFGGVKTKELNYANTVLSSMTLNFLPALIDFSNLAITLSNFNLGSSLSDFGKEFKKFINNLFGTNFAIVAPAIKALNEVTISFQTIGREVIENAKASFENNKEPFQKSIATILDAPIKKLEQEKLLPRPFLQFLKQLQMRVISMLREFEKLGENIVKGLKKGIDSQQPSALSVIKRVMTNVATAAANAVKVDSPSKVFEAIGGWCTKGLANGLSGETKVAVKAGTNMASAVEDGVRDTLGVHSLSQLFSGIGGFVPKSLGSGIQNGKDALLNTAKSLGVGVGDFTIKGVVDSVSGGEGAVTSGINSLLDILTDSPSSPSSEAKKTGASIGGSLTGGFSECSF